MQPKEAQPLSATSDQYNIYDSSARWFHGPEAALLYVTSNLPILRFHQTGRLPGRTAAASCGIACTQLLQHAHAVYLSASSGAWWGLAGAISQRGPLSNVFTAHSV
jgi:hypothetical protein